MMACVAILSSCSPDSFEGADPNGIPSLDGVEPVVAVDQDINQVTFSLPADLKGCMPVWIFYENKGTEKEKVTYSTVNGLKKIFAKAGDYEGEFKLMNRNGVSDGSKSFTFHIDNTIMDYGKYFTQLCGGKENAAKEWRIDNDKAGHLGCGEPGTTGTNWWSAGPNEKKDFGVYDCRMTFSTVDGVAGSYKFNPGESGTMYVNWGVTSNDWQATYWSGKENDDFCVPATEQTVDFDFDVVGEDLYIVFPAHTQFPYIANDDIWNEPRYKVESITPSEVNLVIDNGGIAWHYILTSGAAAVTFNGFKYDQPDNIWKAANVEAGGIYYADGGWSPYPDNGGASFVVENQTANIVLPLATVSQWQAQFPIMTNIVKGTIDSNHTYDFSCVISSTQNIPGMTLKLVEDGDNGVPGSLGIAYDANFLFAETVPVKAYEDYVFYVTDVKGIDLQDNPLKLVLDFGGNVENTDVTIKNFCLIDHAKNTELDKLPSDNPEDGGNTATMDWDANAATNLWKAVEDGSALISVTPWMSGPGWGGGLNPEWSHDGNEWNVILPEGIGGDQWMGQFPINTTLTASMNKKYNFYLVLEADNDAPGVTIKLTETDEKDANGETTAKHDGNYFFADRHDVKAFEPFIYKAEGVSLSQNDAHALSLFFDFGGTPAGTNIKISKIYFEEAVSMNYEDEDNLWKAVDSGSALISVTPWMSGPGWGGGLNPEWSHDGNEWNVILPEGIGGDQWMGQFPINTTLTASMNKKYNFYLVLEADNDAPGVTIKLTETDEKDANGETTAKHDGNYFFADRHDVKAYTPYVYTMKGVKLSQNDAHALSLFFDFGGTPAGTNIKISNIVFKKNGSSAKPRRRR